MEPKLTDLKALIFSGLTAVGMYFGTIHPLDNNISRQQTEAEKLADAVLVQNDKIGKLLERVTVLEYRVVQRGQK